MLEKKKQKEGSRVHEFDIELDYIFFGQ